MNNGSYHKEEYKEQLRNVADKRYGPIKAHLFVCENCEEEFIKECREFTKTFKQVRFCSRSCANSTGGKAKVDKYGVSQYRTVAFKHYKKECLICKFDKVVEVHHLDSDNTNNDISNLVPLCPNHHMMIHRSKYKEEVIQLIEEITTHLRK
jgi:predicted HNH restriction endonuclease